MDNLYRYDLFISYATENADIASYIVERIERRGRYCFIAPRDIHTGADYASEIVKGISNSRAVLLIFSSDSDRSAYVLREINSAVSRNKTVIPLRIQNFLPSEAMEFYLGPTHWLDAFPRVLDSHLESIFAILDSLAAPVAKDDAPFRFPGLQIAGIADLLDAGWTKKQITLREIELDYLCVSPDKYEMNDMTEGTLDDWVDSVGETADVSCALMKDDEMIGYCDFYPVDCDSFDVLRSGSVMIKENMTALYAFGGDFDAYIAMLAVDPAYASQKTYMMLFDWVTDRLAQWEKEDICIDRIGISVYLPIVEKFVCALGFVFSAYNPAKGKVYVTTYSELRENSLFRKRRQAKTERE